MKYLTQYVPQGSGISDGYVVIEEDGVLKAQKLSFDGTTATPDGTAEVIDNVGLFATGMDEPAYEGGTTGGGSCKYYKCASVDTTVKTWSGYELILQDGVYTISETLTEGLSYSGFEPLVGRIYSADGMLEVSSFYQGFQLVSPTDMTSEENDEWKITASGYLNSGTNPYMAFTGYVTDWGWISQGYGTLPQWIQWQNKKRKTMITSYSMLVGTNLPEEAEKRFPGTWILQGSDNGSSWVTVDEVVSHGTVVNGQTYSFTCKNPGSYYYYRIYVTESAVPGEAFARIGQIKAYGQFE